MIIIGERIDVIIEVDKSELEQAKVDVDNFDKKSNEIIETVDKKSRESFFHVLTQARAAYTVGLGLIKASGVSVSYFFRSMMSAAFGAISIMTPLLTAEAVTPGMQWAAALGFAELGVAVAAVVAAQMEQSEIARGFRGAAMALGGIQSMLGNMYYL